MVRATQQELSGKKAAKASDATKPGRRAKTSQEEEEEPLEYIVASDMNKPDATRIEVCGFDCSGSRIYIMSASPSKWPTVRADIAPILEAAREQGYTRSQLLASLQGARPERF